MKRLPLKIVLAAALAAGLAPTWAETVHVVKRGETLYSISRSYGLSVAEVQAANSLDGSAVMAGQKLSIPDPAPVAPAAAEPPGQPRPTEHVVQRGETLYSIGRRYGLSADEVRAANSLSGNNVRVGQTLAIPGKSSAAAAASASAATPNAAAPEAEKPKSPPDIYYTARRGDTWLGIALDHGLTLSEIQSINHVPEGSVLKVGQRVKVSNVPDLKDADPRPYAASAKKGDASLVWPVKASDVTYVSGKVSAVALSARRNESVRAIMAGTVMVAGSYRGYGNVVFVQSKTGHIYAYTGLGSVRVSRGDYVVTGGEVGTAGIDAYSQSPQVTLMVFQNSQPIDPAKAPRG